MSRDRFGFLFWLGWILAFSGSLILAGLFWTLVMSRLFKRIEGVELTLVWALAVFGSWFVLVIPFMRKKEQIWKRLNQDEEKAADAWLKAIGILAGLLIASGLGWSFIFRESLFSRHSGQGFDPRWAKAVFGTWLFLLLPFLVWMYRRADEIFKAAVIRQTHTPRAFKSILVEKSKRILPEKIAVKIKATEPTLATGYVVTLKLKDGGQIPDVFVLNSAEILGVYNRDTLGFEVEDVVDAEPIPSRNLPRYEESKWLRLDGRI
jgi:hypothetical protein